jgi:hypothetical protein
VFPLPGGFILIAILSFVLRQVPLVSRENGVALLWVVVETTLFDVVSTRILEPSGRILVEASRLDVASIRILEPSKVALVPSKPANYLSILGFPMLREFQEFQEFSRQSWGCFSCLTPVLGHINSSGYICAVTSLLILTKTRSDC